MTADDWVDQKPAQPIIRMVDLPESVHTRFKMRRVGQRRKMAEAVREPIEKDLPDCSREAA